PARRAGVMPTRGVGKVTTLLMVRLRLEISIPGSTTIVTQVAEEARFLSFTASGDELTWLPQSEVDALLPLTPSGNVDDALARMQLGRALGRLPALTKHLTIAGKDAAKELVSEHQAVRSASKAGGRAPTVGFLPPADVLGVYVFLPEAHTR
ncbi:MAG: helicase, partial [Mycobacterium sp.]|nr:helicase [Mycobacterium sp.]